MAGILRDWNRRLNDGLVNGWHMETSSKRSQSSDVEESAEFLSDEYNAAVEPQALDKAKLRNPAALANQTYYFSCRLKIVARKANL
jgi:hypothetical protein